MQILVLLFTEVIYSTMTIIGTFYPKLLVRYTRYVILILTSFSKGTLKLAKQESFLTR